MFVLIALAVAAHVGFCEWQITPHKTIVPASMDGRIIVFRYLRAHDKDLYLLSRSRSDRDRDILYGIGLPFVALLIVSVMFKLEDDGSTARNPDHEAGSLRYSRGPFG